MQATVCPSAFLSCLFLCHHWLLVSAAQHSRSASALGCHCLRAIPVMVAGPWASLAHCSSSQARGSSSLYPSRFSCEVTSCHNVSSKGLVHRALMLFDLPLHLVAEPLPRQMCGSKAVCYFVLRGGLAVV